MMEVFDKRAEIKRSVERLFLSAAEKGDKKAIKYALENATGLDFNCVDPNGRTALIIAVENANTDVIEILLDHDVDLGDALLRAVDKQIIGPVQLICEHIKKNNKSDHLYCHSLSGDFHPDLTPLILAAHHNNYDIIQILLNCGATIEDPESYSYTTKKFTLQHSMATINIYKAFASESYMSLTCKDPITEAFQLSSKLKELSERDYEFRNQYIELATQCEEYAADLLGCIRDTKEQVLVLSNESSKTPYKRRNSLELPVIEQAVKHKQKRFIAHPHCQQILIRRWYHGLGHWRKLSFYKAMMMTFVFAISYPIYSLCYIVAPGSKPTRLLKSPYVKFTMQTASSLAFLTLLILQTLSINDKSRSAEELSSMIDYGRNQGPFSVTEWLIILWNIGSSWDEWICAFTKGLNAFRDDFKSKMFDYLTIMLYWIWVVARVTVFFQVTLEQNSMMTNSLNTVLASTTPDQFLNSTQLTYTSTISISTRPSSTGDELPYAAVIAQGIFAIAKALSFLQLIRITVVSLQVGPMQISLGRMLMDIAKFMMIFCLVWFAFSVGLNQLYWYYANTAELTCLLDGEECKQPFATISAALNTLFWALFGVTQLDGLIIGDEGDTVWVIQLVGYILYGIYHLIAIVVLLNILIAMMSNTYTRIDQDADMQWKYSRSRLWITYFGDENTIPPPFNLFPTTKSLVTWCTRLSHKFRTKYENKAMVLSGKEVENSAYQEIVKRMVQRYHFRKQRGDGDSESPTKAGPDPWMITLKEDIAGFKYEMFEAIGEMDGKINQLRCRVETGEADTEDGGQTGSEMFHKLQDAMIEPESTKKSEKTDNVDVAAEILLSAGIKAGDIGELNDDEFIDIDDITD
ncbi:short transient receptor potential channel 4-like [Ptychodera flava]|uniref:short transient receptor potential channel 4-like n=1 Tax=Ptychodera flava TaxID=63121 RepID=UPI00396A2CE0